MLQQKRKVLARRVVTTTASLVVSCMIFDNLILCRCALAVLNSVCYASASHWLFSGAPRQCLFRTRSRGRGPIMKQTLIKFVEEGTDAQKGSPGRDTKRFSKDASPPAARGVSRFRPETTSWTLLTLLHALLQRVSLSPPPRLHCLFTPNKKCSHSALHVIAIILNTTATASYAHTSHPTLLRFKL